MLRARHNYPEEVVVMLQENQCHAGMHYVQRYSWETCEFEVQELANLNVGQQAMTYTIKLNEWWCDYGEF